MFVTFEGIDGSGKTSVLRALQGEYEQKGPIVVTREPGGSELGLELRSMVLTQGKDAPHPLAELFLFLADRAEHVAKIIRPALEKGITVFCDRFTDSTIAYQGAARGLEPELLCELNLLATGGLVPDLTLLLDLPVEQALSRARSRNLREGTEKSEGRFDALALAFHQSVRQGYLKLAAEAPERITVLDASRSFTDVLFQARCALERCPSGSVRAD